MEYLIYEDCDFCKVVLVTLWEFTWSAFGEEV